MKYLIHSLVLLIAITLLFSFNATTLSADERDDDDDYTTSISREVDDRDDDNDDDDDDRYDDEDDRDDDRDDNDENDEDDERDDDDDDNDENDEDDDRDDEDDDNDHNEEQAKKILKTYFTNTYSEVFKEFEKEHFELFLDTIETMKDKTKENQEYTEKQKKASLFVFDALKEAAQESMKQK